MVYRLKDSSITVAFDDIPEGGLNTPLRLEKVTNEQPDCHSSTHAICYLKESDIYMLLLVKLTATYIYQTLIYMLLLVKLTKRRIFVCYRLPFIELLVQYFCMLQASIY